MSALLISKVDALGSRIKALVDQLYREGYVFEYPEEVFPGPAPGVVDAISRIEQEAGEVPLPRPPISWSRESFVLACSEPMSIRCLPKNYIARGDPLCLSLHRRPPLVRSSQKQSITNVCLTLSTRNQKSLSANLCGAHESWLGCDYPDPLVVSPPAHALPDLDDYLEEPEEPFLIPIAPDVFHKANVSGGMYYNVSVSSGCDDPLLNDERHGVSLLDYLAIALGWGGFPGLEGAAGHTWPLGRLQSAAGSLR